MEIMNQLLKRDGIWMAALLLLPCLLSACGHTGQTGKNDQTRELTSYADPQKRDGFETILILMPDTMDTRAVRQAFVDEVSDDIDIVTELVDKNTSSDHLKSVISSISPSCILLMNNHTVKIYKEYQRRNKGTEFSAAVIIMTSYLDRLYKDVDNATGIAYEIPAVTIFVNLRTFLEYKVSKVGVIYRKPFKNYLRNQAIFSAKEKLETVSIDVGMNPMPINIRNAVKELKTKHRIDALWILNDNALLVPTEMIPQGWLPELEKNPIPVVVGIEPLVNKDIHFGTFAIVPDHPALGVQAANIIFELRDENWELGNRGIEQPLSVKTVVDLDMATKRFGFKKEMLGKIDVVVE